MAGFVLRFRPDQREFGSDLPTSPGAAGLAQERYELGRSFALERDRTLIHLGEAESDIAHRRAREIAREIERLGGWTREVRNGYRQARNELARKRGL
jgi:hypothetical protein